MTEPEIQASLNAEMGATHAPTSALHGIEFLELLVRLMRTLTPREAVGRVINRGLLAFGIGVVFIWFSLRPEHFKEAPPSLIRVIMFAAGAGLAYGGVVSMRFLWKRGNLIQSKMPVAAEIIVLEDDDSERGTLTVHIRVDGRCQALGVDRSSVVDKYIDGVLRRGDVWLDEKGAVYAIAVAGEQFKTLIGGREIPAGRFGEKE